MKVGRFDARKTEGVLFRDFSQTFHGMGAELQGKQSLDGNQVTTESSNLEITPKGQKNQLESRAQQSLHASDD